MRVEEAWVLGKIKCEWSCYQESISMGKEVLLVVMPGWGHGHRATSIPKCGRLLRHILWAPHGSLLSPSQACYTAFSPCSSSNVAAYLGTPHGSILSPSQAACSTAPSPSVTVNLGTSYGSLMSPPQAACNAAPSPIVAAC